MPELPRRPGADGDLVALTDLYNHDVRESPVTFDIEALFDLLAGEDVHRAVAGITLPNPASVALHHRLGFAPVGVFAQVGYKFGRYWDVQWWQRAMR